MFMLKSTHNKEIMELMLEIMLLKEDLIQSGYYDYPTQNDKGQWKNPTTGQFVKAPT